MTDLANGAQAHDPRRFLPLNKPIYPTRHGCLLKSLKRLGIARHLPRGVLIHDPGGVIIRRLIGRPDGDYDAA
jgi:hypothetical protein